MRRLAVCALLAASLCAQVYSPSVLVSDQPDPTDLKRFAAQICRNAKAVTARERAEAIWRYFLTDGRFVKPGFWYHIAGWTYEEPSGEVLDPLKLLNSYGFGLCYHIAPLLEAVFEAAGFEDARVWFLTGHTVAEVFYEGSWHYFDSDMMGYNVRGVGSFRNKPIVSVRDLESDPRIILDKLSGRRSVRHGVVDDPWYPADVRAGAMSDLASLFTTRDDNYVFPFTRYSSGHDMSFVLRPGEKLVRYFRPEQPGLFYLPYAFDGQRWHEFPQEIARYGIRTADGPRSQKDARSWATGRIEYSPSIRTDAPVLTFAMPSPWVIIDARFNAEVRLPTAEHSLLIETSLDGQQWRHGAERSGPFEGEWVSEPAVLVRSANGRLTHVSGTYGYQVRVTRRGPSLPEITSLKLTSRIQLNPRTLPALTAGKNHLQYRSGSPVVRADYSADLRSLTGAGLRLVEEAGQQMLCPESGGGEALLEVAGARGFEAGARFLQLRNGLAPEKRTAETRPTKVQTQAGAASIEWALAPDGPWHTGWSFPEQPEWRDTQPPERVLHWPEAFVSQRAVNRQPANIYVRLRTSGPCVDNLRLAVFRDGARPAGKLKITHHWSERGVPKQHQVTIDGAAREHAYSVAAGIDVRNDSITIESLP